MNCDCMKIEELLLIEFSDTDTSKSDVKRKRRWENYILRFFFSRPTYNIYTGNDYYYRGLTYQDVPKRIIYSRGERREEDMWAGILSNICLLDFFFFNYYLLFLSRRLVVPLFFYSHAWKTRHVWKR